MLWRRFSMPCNFFSFPSPQRNRANSSSNTRVRERLKDILRQYELRERHFECVIRSKELEVLLSRARAAEQKQLAEGEKARAERADEDVRLSNYHHPTPLF